MDLIFLVGTLLAAIILVVVLIMRLHLHAFVSLVIACFFVGFVTGMPLLQICKSIEAGMGSTLGFLATVLGFGSILGKMLETSGGAERLARTLINRFGKKKANWAMMFVGLITGIPVFFQVGFVLLIPLVISVARATGLSIIAIGVPIGVSLQVVHCMLPLVFLFMPIRNCENNCRRVKSSDFSLRRRLLLLKRHQKNGGNSIFPGSGEKRVCTVRNLKSAYAMS